MNKYVVVDNLSFPGESRYMHVRREANEPDSGWSKWNQRAVFSGTREECEEYIEQRYTEEQEREALFAETEE